VQESLIHRYCLSSSTNCALLPISPPSIFGHKIFTLKPACNPVIFSPINVPCYMTMKPTLMYYTLYKFECWWIRFFIISKMPLTCSSTGRHQSKLMQELHFWRWIVRSERRPWCDKQQPSTSLGFSNVTLIIVRLIFITAVSFHYWRWRLLTSRLHCGLSV